MDPKGGELFSIELKSEETLMEDSGTERTPSLLGETCCPVLEGVSASKVISSPHKKNKTITSRT